MRGARIRLFLRRMTQLVDVEFYSSPVQRKLQLDVHTYELCPRATYA